jgi:hypothetical protein
MTRINTSNSPVFNEMAARQSFLKPSINKTQKAQQLKTNFLEQNNKPSKNTAADLHGDISRDDSVQDKNAIYLYSDPLENGHTLEKTKTDPKQQAKTDAVNVRKTYDDTLRQTNSPLLAAEAAASQIDQQISQHPNDTVYSSTLLQESKGTLKQIGMVLGEHVDGKGKYNSEKSDKQAIKNIVHHLASAADQNGIYGAALIAREIEPSIPNKSELHQVDDGFYDYQDQTKDKGLLYGALYDSLQSKGKGKAAEELITRNGAPDGAARVVKQTAEGVIHLAENGVDLAVDTAKGTVDLIGEGAEAAEKAAKFAVKNGLKLVGKARDGMIDQFRKVADSTLHIEDKINELGVGDSYKLGLNIDVAGTFEIGTVGIGTGSDIKIEKKGENEYEVSGSINVHGSLVVNAGIGGKVAFTAKTPEEAKQFAMMIATGPKSSELKSMRNQLKSVEINTEAGYSFSPFKMGAGHMESSLGVGAKVKQTESLEFENGKPKNIVISYAIGLKANAASNKYLDNVTKNPSREVLATMLGVKSDQLSVNLEGEISIEVKIPVENIVHSMDDLKDGKVVEAIKTAAQSAEVTLKASGQFETSTGGGKFDGQRYEGKIKDLKMNDIDLIWKSLQGDQTAWNNLKNNHIKSESKKYTRTDESALDLHLMTMAGGFSLDTESSITDVTSVS